MLFLEIDITVKFRAFGLDFGTKHEHAIVPVPELPGVPSVRKVWSIDRNGVKVTITAIPAPTELNNRN